MHFSYIILCLLMAVGSWGYVSPSGADEDLPTIKYGDPLPANLFVELSKAINPAVVNISTTQRPKTPTMQSPYGRDPITDLFQQFMGGSGGAYQAQPVESLGTGFIIRPDGLILTNAHVVNQADLIQVKISSKPDELFQAEVIGQDTRTDVALIKIETKEKLPVASLGSSKDLQVGEWVAAFGNPYGHDHSVTKGIISAIGRRIDEINLLPFIQTDASINPGNSGGPLVNTKGQVIAVNTAIDARAQGIGFAIPIDDVKSILPQLLKNGKIDRAFLGIGMTDLNDLAARDLGLEDADGSLVYEVVPNSPAAKAGMRPYDFITEFNGKRVRSSNELVNEVQRLTAGKKAAVKFIREGKPKKVQVALTSQPGNNATLQKDQRNYKGQKAPFNLGFKVSDYSQKLVEAFDIPPLRKGQPIVIDVDPNSPAARAGLAPGDVILDVNKEEVDTAKDVLRKLRKDSHNLLRVLKRDRVVILYMRS
ncbi:MAG: Do family serine endopeptidase [Bdellovibrionales bacterium]|nr:Do family serine endopeptidase [Bdellovibrionales bacterium]